MLWVSFAVAAQSPDDVQKIQSGSCGSQSDGSDKCDVSGAYLREITLNGQYHHLMADGTNFSGSKLRNAYFSNANLEGASIENFEVFTNNTYCNTTMPDGSTNDRDC